jgi:hypothetical protein
MTWVGRIGGICEAGFKRSDVGGQPVSEKKVAPAKQRRAEAYSSASKRGKTLETAPSEKFSDDAISGALRGGGKGNAESDRAFHRLSESIRQAIDKSIDNVLAFGDTDVLPRSFELAVISEMRSEVEDLVAEIFLDYSESLERMPVFNDAVLSPVGQTGFRIVSQLDPVWNIYFLSLVIAIGSEIERARVPISKAVVHSFRFDEAGTHARVFFADSGWQTFVQSGRERAERCSHVLITDISDFYPRVYHHRLENALKKVAPGSEIVSKLVKLLMEFSGGVSYGLPVGGPASRLLAELLLNATDRKLLADGVSFTRFVDDFRVFAPSREAAYGALISLAQFLGTNEGLSLQKTKTRVLSSEEFIGMSLPPKDDPSSTEQGSLREFMQLKIHYDPYSETAADDYEELKRVVQSFDVVGMLAAEMRKSQIDEGLVKKVVKSVRHLDEKRRDICISALAENIELLAPVFQVVVQTFLALSDELEAKVRTAFVCAVKKMFSQKSHVLQIPANQSWAIRVLEKDYDDESERILNELYQGARSLGVRRDVIIAMANGDSSWFVSDVRKRFQSLNGWERRAVICASFCLEDEGAHWRKKLKLSGFEKVVQRWAAVRKARSGARLRIPL